jgi:hypothetical protein
LIILLHRQIVIREAACPQNDPAGLLRPVVAEIGTVLVVSGADGRLRLVPTGSDAVKQDAIDNLLADFDVGTISHLEEAVTDLIANATDACGRVDEQLVRHHCQMRASRRAYERCKPRGKAKSSNASRAWSEYQRHCEEGNETPHLS